MTDNDKNYNINFNALSFEMKSGEELTAQAAQSIADLPEQLVQKLRPKRTPRKLVKFFYDLLHANQNTKYGMLTDDSGYGLLFFYHSEPGMRLDMGVHELELDCRGNMTQFDNSKYIITIGEVKSSMAGLEKESGKIEKRLSTIALAVRVINAPNEISVFKRVEIGLPLKQAKFNRVQIHNVECIYNFFP